VIHKANAAAAKAKAPVAGGYCLFREKGLRQPKINSRLKADDERSD
jgi:hypothetical protein